MFDLEIGKIKMDMDRADKLEIKENIEKDIPVPVEVEKVEDKKVENNYNYPSRGI